ncbi:MAG: glycosyltransferase [Candidatus Omnitrophica bacterium]|nr:glycosyltransferase [Candidatus Omnitrophota bacterium]
MGTDNPKVSVLIPAYNAEKFIQRTIDSVLNQTFRDLELIVVDDGSSDKTADIVRQAGSSDSRISYFYQANKGLSHTRNRLAALAKGEFIAFLDHDDEWLPEKIGKQLGLFEKGGQTGLVFSDAYIKKYGRTIATCFKERRPFRGDVFYQYLFSDNFAPLFTVMMPRSILYEFLPFSPDYEVNEEFDIFLKVARKYRFDYIDEPLAVYHIHGGNTIMSKSQRFIEESFRILDDWIAKDPEILRRYKRQLRNRYAQLFYKKGLMLLERGNKAESRRAALDSFRQRAFNMNAVKLSVKLILGSGRAG